MLHGMAGKSRARWIFVVVCVAILAAAVAVFVHDRRRESSINSAYEVAIGETVMELPSSTPDDCERWVDLWTKCIDDWPKDRKKHVILMLNDTISKWKEQHLRYGRVEPSGFGAGGMSSGNMGLRPG